jgi:arylsulfatase A-like enzyme
MSRLRCSLAAAALVLAGAACGRDPRPDVLLIVLDAVRADHLGVYGYERPTSPTLDAFAREAVVYRTAIAPGTWTPPSHASMLTGLLPSSHGVGHVGETVGDGIYALDPGVETLAERMQGAGYRTAAFIGNGGYLSPVFGLAQGFETYRIKGLRSVDDLARVLAEWLERRRGRPVFALVNVIDAHEPYEPPPPYDRMFPGRLEHAPPRHPQDEQNARGWFPSPEEIAHYVGRYDGEIRHIDDRLGDVFAALRRSGRWDNALVIVTADHGELFGERNRLGHGGDPIYPLVRVPLIVKYPQRARVGTEAAPVSLADIPATVLATLGLPPLAPGQRPLWEQTGPAVAEHGSPRAFTRAAFGTDGLELVEVVRDGDRKLVLYDLARDPAETAPLDPTTHAAGPRLDAELRRVVASLPALRRGPVVYPRGDALLAERLRALGYLR